MKDEGLHRWSSTIPSHNPSNISSAASSTAASTGWAAQARAFSVTNNRAPSSSLLSCLHQNRCKSADFAKSNQQCNCVTPAIKRPSYVSKVSQLIADAKLGVSSYNPLLLGQLNEREYEHRNAHGPGFHSVKWFGKCQQHIKPQSRIAWCPTHSIEHYKQLLW